MGALSPSNGKYRRSWLTWGNQAIPSKQYKDNYDKINWGEKIPGIVKEDLTNPNHYKVLVEEDKLPLSSTAK